MEEDIKKKLLKIAQENVNKKFDEERAIIEEKIKNEIQDVNFILELIEKKMLYKTIGDWRKPIKFEMITKEIFLEDYMSEPKESWRRKGIKIKDYESFGENYNLKIKINEEIEYKHIGYIIQDFESNLKDKTRRISSMTEGLRELEDDFEKLVAQEKNIKMFIEDYNNTKKDLNK